MNVKFTSGQIALNGQPIGQLLGGALGGSFSVGGLTSGVFSWIPSNTSQYIEVNEEQVEEGEGMGYVPPEAPRLLEVKQCVRCGKTIPWYEECAVVIPGVAEVKPLCNRCCEVVREYVESGPITAGLRKLGEPSQEQYKREVEF